MASLFRRSRKSAPSRPPARARLALEPLEDRAVPATFTVTTLADETDPADGLLSLREAITAANANFDADVIQFAAGLSGTINLSIPGNDDTNAGGDLDVRAPVSIQGLGADLLTVRQTVANERVFEVSGGGAPILISGLTITGGNGDNGGGGGVMMLGAASLTLSAVEVTGNSSSSSGGGVLELFPGSDLVVRNSTIANNSTGPGRDGGGVEIADGSALIVNSTISGNTAGGERGGGVKIELLSDGLTIRNSTIVGNSSTGSGAGLSMPDGGTVKLSSTIVAGNGAPIVGDIEGAVQAASDHNLIGNDNGLMGITNGVNGNLVGKFVAPIDPLLGPLQLNGGRTRTHALLAGSPALDKGFAPGEVTSDQRGSLFVRTFGAAPDIGAFEVQPNPGPTAQALQTAVQAIGILQPSGARMAAFAFGDVSGDSINDIVLALRLRNNRPLVVTFDGIDGHIRGVFQPFTAPLRNDSKVRLLTVDVASNPGAEIVLLVSAAPGVPRLSVFTADGGRVL
jgi:CSLREA domain-containing protein